MTKTRRAGFRKKRSRGGRKTVKRRAVKRRAGSRRSRGTKRRGGGVGRGVTFRGGNARWLTGGSPLHLPRSDQPDWTYWGYVEPLPPPYGPN